jgi:hypothetical protein
MFIKETGLKFSSLVVSLFSFGMSVILASKKEFDSVPSISISWKRLRGIDTTSSVGGMKANGEVKEGECSLRDEGKWRDEGG